MSSLSQKFIGAAYPGGELRASLSNLLQYRLTNKEGRFLTTGQVDITKPDELKKLSEMIKERHTGGQGIVKLTVSPISDSETINGLKSQKDISNMDSNIIGSVASTVNNLRTQIQSLIGKHGVTLGYEAGGQEAYNKPIPTPGSP